MGNYSFAGIMVLVTVILMDILGGAEMDLFVPSFSELQKYFNLTPFWTEALLSLNFIGFCGSLFLVGALADRYGRKPLIYSGLIIFILGSILCVGAPSYSFLLIGRFLQGVGVAAPATLCFLIIADSYPMDQQRSLMGILNGIVNVSVGAAPVIGSYITLYFQWRGNFIALLLLGIITLGMTIFFIPRPQLSATKTSLTLRGYLPLLQSKPLLLLMMNILFFSLTYWVFVGIAPILYMKDLGVSLLHFGYYQGSLAFVFSMGSIVVGLMIKRYNVKKMLLIGNWVCVVSLVSIGWLTWVDSCDPLLITLAFIPYSIAVSVPVVVIYPLCLDIMPHAKGKVSAMIQAIRLILTAACLQIAGYYYTGSFQNIGIIIFLFLLGGIITLFWILKKHEFS